MYKQGKLVNSEVRIENTTLCNAKCAICPRDKLTRPLMTMGLTKFINLVDQCVDLGAKSVSIFGYGEPLMDFGLADKVSYCTTLGLDTFVTTNVDLLDHSRTFELLEAGLKHIRFSVHGLFSKTYSKVHGGISFIEVIRNAFNFIIVNKKRFSSQCKVSVSVIPMNNERVEDIVDFWEDNVDWLEIWKPHNWADAKDFRALTKERKVTCGRPFNGPIQINSDGTIMACCMDFDGKLKLGDTNENTIREIFEYGVALSVLQDFHSHKDKGGLVCAKCDQLNIGDQPLLYSSRDPECGIGKTSSTKQQLCDICND